MAKQSAYICLDTNVYVFCATETKDAMNLELLNKLLDDMDKKNVRLLVPEVIQLELPKVIQREQENIQTALNELKREIEQNTLLGTGTKKELKESIRKQKKKLETNIKEINESLYNRINNKKKSTVVQISDGNIINEATKLAIRGVKPAKSSSNYGLLQPDCLIAASIKHFQSLNPDCRIAFCTDNTRDFATKDENDSFSLHPDIKDYLGDIEFCSRPGQLYEGILSGNSSNTDEIKRLDDAYDVALRRSIDAKNLERLQHFYDSERYATLFKGVLETALALNQLDDTVNALAESGALTESLNKIKKSSSAFSKIFSSQNNIENLTYTAFLENYNNQRNKGLSQQIQTHLNENKMDETIPQEKDNDSDESQPKNE